MAENMEQGERAAVIDLGLDSQTDAPLGTVAVSPHLFTWRDATGRVVYQNTWQGLVLTLMYTGQQIT